LAIRYVTRYTSFRRFRPITYRAPNMKYLHLIANDCKQRTIRALAPPENELANLWLNEGILGSERTSLRKFRQ
jgi:hypothetical protein